MVFNTGAALLDAIVLAVVSHESEGTYGYKITQDVRSAINVSESTLYPVLRRLQKDECLEVYDRQYDGRNRRYYKVTEKGMAQLNLYQVEWKNYSRKSDGMNREEFMAKLKALLGDIPADEREEALQYYEDYFDDAGADNEAEVIRELESPQRVAAMIKNDLKHTGNDGEFTENGYEQEWASKKEVPQRKGYSYQSGQTGEYSYEASQGRNDKLVKIALIVLIALIVCPVVIPVGVGIFGVIAGLLIAAVCFFAALVIASLAVVLAGFVVAVTGIGVGIAIHSVPAVLLMAGIGLILIALGVLATLFTGKLCIVMYPAMFRFIVKLCRKPFHRKAVSE